MDFIFPVRALTSVTYPPCIYEGMGMHSWSTVVCQIWGQFRWNLVIYGSKCPILKGVHQTAKSPNGTIDTGLNHSESIPIWLGDLPVQLQGRTLCGTVTAGRPKLNILEILKHFWPASEPCMQATIKDMDFIFPVPALRSVIYPPCKYESMDMHSWSTVVCQNWGQFRWNLVIYGSKCRILNGVHQTGRSTNGL